MLEENQFFSLPPRRAIYTWYIRGIYCQLGDYILGENLKDVIFLDMFFLLDKGKCLVTKHRFIAYSILFTLRSK